MVLRRQIACSGGGLDRWSAMVVEAWLRPRRSCVDGFVAVCCKPVFRHSQRRRAYQRTALSFRYLEVRAEKISYDGIDDSHR